MNRMEKVVSQIKSKLPESLRPLGLSLMFNAQVKLAGTAGVRIEQLDTERAVVKVANRRRVQNHIGGVHACAMALAAETATGVLMGMNVPDDKLPLCKSMRVDFRKVAQGGLQAVATLDQEQQRKIREEDKGDTRVKVVVTDEAGKEPIQAEMLWAWVPKTRMGKSVAAAASAAATAGD